MPQSGTENFSGYEARILVCAKKTRIPNTGRVHLLLRYTYHPNYYYNILIMQKTLLIDIPNHQSIGNNQRREFI